MMKASAAAIPAPIAVDQNNKFTLLKQRLLVELRCPLTQQLLLDPVYASDGHTYSRVAIETHLAKTRISPMTRATLSMHLVTNYFAKTVLDLLAGNMTEAQFLNEIDQRLACPISLAMMDAPMLLPDGMTYEKEHVEAAFKSGNVISPLTNLPIANVKVFNELADRIIATYLTLYPKDDAYISISRWETVFTLIEADNDRLFRYVLARLPRLLTVTFNQAVAEGLTLDANVSFDRTMTIHNAVFKHQAVKILNVLREREGKRAVASFADLQSLNDNLAKAVINKNAPLVQALLRDGATIATVYRGDLLLIHAVNSENIEVVECLLKHGALNVAKQPEGEKAHKAVHHAVLKNNVPMLDLLQQYGADLEYEARLEARGPYETPLELAAANLKYEALNYLLTQRVKLILPHRVCPLTLAVASIKQENQERGIAVIQALLAVGKSEYDSIGGPSPLASAHTLAVAQIFLELGWSGISNKLFVSLSLEELTRLLDQYPLSRLLSSENQGVVLEHLIETKMDAHVRLCVDKGILRSCTFPSSRNGDSVLQVCMKLNPNLELIKYLLAHGAKLKSAIPEQAKNDAFPRHWYDYVKNSRSLFTRDERGSYNFFERMAQEGHVDVIESIVDAQMTEWSVDDKRTHLRFAMGVAVTSGQLSVVQSLYAKGVTLWDVLYNNKTAFSFARDYKQTAIAKYLLENELEKLRQKFQENPEANKVILLIINTYLAALQGSYKEYLLSVYFLPVQSSESIERVASIRREMEHHGFLKPVTPHILMQRYEEQFARATTQAEFDELLLIIKVMRNYWDSRWGHSDFKFDRLWGPVMHYWPSQPAQQFHAMHIPDNFIKLLQHLFAIPMINNQLRTGQGSLYTQLVTLFNQEQPSEVLQVEEQQQCKLPNEASAAMLFSEYPPLSASQLQRKIHEELTGLLLTHLETIGIELKKSNSERYPGLQEPNKRVPANNISKNSEGVVELKLAEEDIVLRLLKAKDAQGRTCLQVALARQDISRLQQLFALGQPFSAQLPELETIFWQLVERYNELAGQFEVYCKKQLLEITPEKVGELTAILTNGHAVGQQSGVILLIAHLLVDPIWTNGFITSLQLRHQDAQNICQGIFLLKAILATAEEQRLRLATLKIEIEHALAPKGTSLLLQDTCLHLVKTYQLISALAYLLPKQLRPLPVATLHTIAVDGRFELLSLFVNARIDLSTVKVAEGHTILSYLVMVGDLERMTLLLRESTVEQRQRFLAVSAQESAWTMAWSMRETSAPNMLAQKTLLLSTLIQYGADITQKKAENVTQSYLELILAKPEENAALIEAIFTYQPQVITATVLARLMLGSDSNQFKHCNDLLATVLGGNNAQVTAVRKSRLAICFAEPVYEKESAVSYLVRQCFVALKDNDAEKKRQLMLLLAQVLNCGTHAQSEQTLAWLSHHYGKATANEKQFSLELIDIFLNAGVSPLVPVSKPGLVLFPFVKAQPPQSLLVQALDNNDFVLLERYLQKRERANAAANGSGVPNAAAYAQGCHLLLAKEMDMAPQLAYFKLFLARGASVDAHTLEIVTSHKSVNVYVLAALLEKKVPRTQQTLTHAKRIFAQLQTMIVEANQGDGATQLIAELCNNEHLGRYFTEASPILGLSYKQLERGRLEPQVSQVVQAVPAVQVQEEASRSRKLAPGSA